MVAGGPGGWAPTRARTYLCSPRLPVAAQITTLPQVRGSPGPAPEQASHLELKGLLWRGHPLTRAYLLVRSSRNHPQVGIY